MDIPQPLHSMDIPQPKSMQDSLNSDIISDPEFFNQVFPDPTIITQSISQIGDIAAITGMSAANPAGFMRSVLEFVYVYSDLPW